LRRWGGGRMDLLTCTAPALEKIIAAVGKKYTGDLDRDGSVSDLRDAWSKLLPFTALGSEKDAPARKKLFDAIVDSEIKFKKHVLAPCGVKYAASSLFRDRARFDGFAGELDRVIGEATDLAEQNSRGGWVRLSRPPKEWMAGEVLPEVFQRNFH